MVVYHSIFYPPSMLLRYHLLSWLVLIKSSHGTLSPQEASRTEIARDTTPTLQVSSDGTCGPGITCLGSIFGSCCSEHYYCGTGETYCGTGCHPAFGSCNDGSISLPSPTATCSGTARTTLTFIYTQTSTSVVTSTNVIPVRSTTTVQVVTTTTNTVIETTTSTALYYILTSSTVYVTSTKLVVTSTVSTPDRTSTATTPSQTFAGTIPNCR